MGRKFQVGGCNRKRQQAPSTEKSFDETDKLFAVIQ